MTAFSIATAALWIVAIALVRQHLIDAGMHPRRGQREEKRAGGQYPKFERAILPLRSVDQSIHNEGI